MQTGFYLRLMRDGKAQSLDITEFSDQELRNTVRDWSDEKKINWIISLVMFIKTLEAV